MSSYVVTVDLYKRPNFDLRSRDLLADALTDAAWARSVYQPDQQFAGYSQQVFITQTDDDNVQTVIRRWRWTSKDTKGNGYWGLEIAS